MDIRGSQSPQERNRILRTQIARSRRRSGRRRRAAKRSAGERSEESLDRRQAEVSKYAHCRACVVGQHLAWILPYNAPIHVPGEFDEEDDEENRLGWWLGLREASFAVSVSGDGASARHRPRGLAPKEAGLSAKSAILGAENPSGSPQPSWTRFLAAGV